MMALNVENWEAIMMTHERRNQKCDNDDSERQNWEAMMMALNAKTENVMMMALNAETKNAMMMALNAKTENVDGSERQDWKC